MNFFKTTKGKEACSYEGYSYRVYRTNNIRKIWRCLNKPCSAMLWTSLNNKFQEIKGIHNHLHLQNYLV